MVLVAWLGLDCVTFRTQMSLPKRNVFVYHPDNARPMRKWTRLTFTRIGGEEIYPNQVARRKHGDCWLVNVLLGTFCPSAHQNFHVRVIVGEVLNHFRVMTPCASTQTAADVIRKGNAPRSRVPMQGANLAEACFEGTFSCRCQIVVRGW